MMSRLTENIYYLLEESVSQSFRIIEENMVELTRPSRASTILRFCTECTYHLASEEQQDPNAYAL